MASSTLILIADAPAPALDWHRLGATQVDFASVLIGAGALLYGVGIWRVGQLQPGHPWSLKRTVAFFGGLAVTWVAVEAVVGVYDDVLFYDHMIQHLMLIMVAAPLFAMGAPLELLDRSTTGVAHRLAERAMGSKVAEVLGHPIVGFGLYAVIIPVFHLTSFYNYTLTNEAAHDAEHLGFLVVGYLFWRPVVAIEPARHSLYPGVRLLYLVLAVPVDTFTGLALNSATHELFPAYYDLHRAWGPSLVQDLHIGGAIMWVGGDLLMMLGAIPVAFLWARHEEQKAIEIDAALDTARADSNAAEDSVDSARMGSSRRPEPG